jgi:predicted nucleic acid-binding protein
MVLLDSDIIILASKKQYQYLREFIGKNECAVSKISWVEVLGFPDITKDEQTYLDFFFDEVFSFALTDDIISLAISLRTKKRMSLGDSIIAATAIIHEFDLSTNNEKDFSWIEGLTIINPLKK